MSGFYFDLEATNSPNHQVTPKDLAENGPVLVELKLNPFLVFSLEGFGGLWSF
jgi:hypothetical protein